MKPFEIIEEHEEYKGGRFHFIRSHLKTPEGKDAWWTYVRQNDSVLVIALDDKHCLYVKKEWRLNRRDYFWEFPGGYVEMENPSDQDLLEAANRELQEEVGMKAKRLSILTSYYESNHSTKKCHVILATELEPSKLEGDRHEYVIAEKISFDTAWGRLIEEQMPTAHVLIAMTQAKESLSKLISEVG